MNLMIRLILHGVASLLLTSSALAGGPNMQQICHDVPQLIEQTQVVMKQERGWREVYVNKAWERLTFEAKKGIVTMIAKCLQRHEAVTVYDGYSGKEVASYGPWQGFKVH